MDKRDSRSVRSFALTVIPKGGGGDYVFRVEGVVFVFERLVGLPQLGMVVVYLEVRIGSVVQVLQKILIEVHLDGLL